MFHLKIWQYIEKERKINLGWLLFVKGKTCFFTTTLYLEYLSLVLNDESMFHDSIYYLFPVILTFATFRVYSSRKPVLFEEEKVANLSSFPRLRIQYSSVSLLKILNLKMIFLISITF